MAVTSAGSLDVNSIVNQLMVAESRPFAAMQAKEKAYTAQLAAYGTLSGALGGFKTNVTALADPAKFNAVGSSSSEPTVLTASAAKGAIKGSYSVNVTQLSQAQTLTATGQTSVTAQIGAGASTTLSFEFGSITGGVLAAGAYTGATFTQDATRVAKTVTIDSSNNSLQGIRDAINAAGVGVSATIVSDGSANPNRLVLTSTSTGETSSMRIGVSGDAALSSLLAYDPEATQQMSQNSVAQNAKLTINGVAVTSPSNNVAEAIQGVTLSALKIGTSTVSITNDNSGVKTALESFVKSYNELNTTITSLSAVTPDLKPGAPRAGGPLQGDATTRSLQTSLRRMFSQPVPGLEGSSVTSMSQLGVSFQKDGSLKLDVTKLNKAMETSQGDVAKFLSTAGSASDSLVTFVGSTSSSTPGSKALYVSQLATQGTGVGSVAADTNIVAGVNDTLSLTINGITSTATLVAGSYTGATLATHVQSIINGALGATDASPTSGTGVTVSQNTGIFTITSNKYGSLSKVDISGNGAASLLGTPTLVDGIDVAGTIGGQVATGSGQNLTGGAGSGSAGIEIKVTGGSFPADRGTISVSRGIGAQFTEMLDSFLKTDGSIPGKNSGLNKSLSDLAKQRDALNTRLTETEKRLRREFSTLDVTLSNMGTTSNYLTQQLAAISNIR